VLSALLAGMPVWAKTLPPPPFLGDPTAAALYDPTTGQFLYARRAAQRLAPASTTKLMTALLVVTRGPSLDAWTTVTAADIAVGGSSAPLVAGERIRIRDLLYGLLLVSGNDAAMALAQATAGSVPRFVRMMNATARALGATHTRFMNPDGLPNRRHLTTAADLARIAAAAMGQPEIRRVLETEVYPFPNPDGVGTVPMVNQDQLLWSLPGIVGGKIGYTTAAGETMAVEAHRHGMTLVATTLHDTYAGLFADPAALLDWGFAHYRRVRLIRRGEVVARLTVRGFGRRRTVPVVAAGSVWRDLPVGEAAPPVRAFVPRRAPAGAPRGRSVGTVVAGGGSMPLLAVPAVLGAATPRDPARPPAVPVGTLVAGAGLVAVGAWAVRRRRRARRPRRYRLRRVPRISPY
jgi:D-alanyl-D-alanine carboxypeptidase (penicillin-binding protein 5/6)